MLLQISHETRYEYSPPVENAQHIAYLRPLDQSEQRLLQHALDISPQPAHLRTVQDIYGNYRSHFSFSSSHERLIVRAQSLVHTLSATQGELADSAAWERVREHGQYQAAAPWDASIEFAFPSPCAPRHPVFAEFARPSFSAGRPIAEAAMDLMSRIHRHMRYESHSTEVHTPALEAFEQRRGVCQDFAHILIACCRSMGLPARYVSGYLLTTPAPGQPRLIGSDASHAWASVYCPPADRQGRIDASLPGLWLNLDPTNDRLSGSDYVTLAIGRDYLDVSPLRGVIQGGGRHQLSVAVTVSAVETDQSLL